MSNDSFLKELQDRALLQSQGLHHTQNALHKTTAGRTVAAKAATSPQHGPTLDALGVIVRRLDPVDDHECAQSGIAYGSSMQ